MLLQDVLLMALVGLFVLLALAFLIRTFYKPGRTKASSTRSSREVKRSAPAVNDPPDLPEDSEGRRIRRKKKKKRRDHRPRNATLSETGGLPPMKRGDIDHPSI